MELPAALLMQLRRQGIAHLSRREHARQELSQKLSRDARRWLARECPDAHSKDSLGPALDALINEVLDWLARQGYQSQDRALQSRLHQRQARWGSRKIMHELESLGLSMDEEQKQALKHTELDRARLVWARRFGALPQDARERAQQIRFLMARGFSSETIRQVLRGPAAIE